jgi:hypothetical protein
MSLKNCYSSKSNDNIKELEENLWERKGRNHFWHDIKSLDYIFMGVSTPSITYEDSSGFLKVATYSSVKENADESERRQKKSLCNPGYLPV